MSKLTNVLPNVWRLTKYNLLLFVKAAKYNFVDAALAIITLSVIIYSFFSPVWFEGAAIILFVYAYWTTIRINRLRIQIDELKKLINPTSRT